MNKLNEARRQLRKYADKEKRKSLQRFFKTGPGEYAEGDIFLGVMAPFIRKVVNQFQDLLLSDLIKLMRSKIHEERLLALLIMARQFEKEDAKGKERIFKAYLANTKFINNWDLVDLSAPHIVGGFLAGKDSQILYKLANSPWLWDRRIAILATFAFIRQDNFNDTFAISRFLLGDKEDLIHKACGWMLRETGKRNAVAQEKFLRANCKSMPRTMLRYAIEKFPEKKRKFYLGVRS